MNENIPAFIIPAWVEMRCCSWFGLLSLKEGLKRKHWERWRVVDPSSQGEEKQDRGQGSQWRPELGVPLVQKACSPEAQGAGMLCGLVSFWKLDRMTEVPRARGSLVQRESGEVGDEEIMLGLMDHVKDSDLFQWLANFFCKGPDNLCYNSSSLISWQKKAATDSAWMNECGCAPIHFI